MAGDLCAYRPLHTWNLLLSQLSSALAAYGLSDRPVGYGFGKDVDFWSGDDAALAGGVAPRGAIVLHDARLLFQDLPRQSPLGAGPAGAGGRRRAVPLRIDRAGLPAHEGTSWSWHCRFAPAQLPRRGRRSGDGRVLRGHRRVQPRGYHRVPRRPGWSVFDIRRLASAHGSARLTDVRLDLLGRFPTSGGRARGGWRSASRPTGRPSREG